MKKIFVLLVFSFLLIGCGSNKEEEINNFVLSSSYNEIINKVSVSINNINYFPTEEYEEEFIYYIKAMIKNINKFSNEEKNEIYNELQKVNYTFKYNNLNYTNNNFLNDILFFK